MQKENTTNKRGNLDQPNVTGMVAKGAAVNVLELFSGIGGFTKGLMDAGMKINKHYYSEIDKHAIANYKYNFKNAEYIGSVTDVRGAGIERPNIITFGSPCQDFSLAGKRKGMEGQRSSLILHAIRLIGECRPDFFIWENVKGAYSSNDGADFWGIIQAFANIGGYRLEWQLLNTSWFLPQNRERIYLIGHLAKGSFRGIFPITENGRLFNEQEQPNERRTQAQHSTTIRAGSMRADDTFIQAPKVAGALTGGGHSGGLHSDMTIIQIGNNNKSNDGTQPYQQDRIYDSSGIVPALNKGKSDLIIKSNTAAGEEIAEEGDSINFSNPSSKTRRGRVGKGKAQTLDTACNQGVIQMIGTLNKTITKRTHDTPVEINEYLKERKGKLTIGHITSLLLLPKTQVEHYFRTDKSRAIPTPEIWDKLKSILFMDDRYDAQVKDFYQKESEFESTQRVYSDQGAAPTITNGGQSNIMNGSNIRRLTEIECERLQGFPDNWTEFGNYDGVIKSIPKTQRYKLLGNAVTVNVVKAIGCRLLAAAPFAACQ